jgi:hypothetical protein
VVKAIAAIDEALQQLFYRLRRGFRSQVKALSSTFDLDTPLKEILHKDQWPQVWAALRAEVGAARRPASIPWPGLLSGGPETVRELIWQVAASLPKPDVAAGAAWTRPRIQAEIRRIVGEQIVPGITASRLGSWTTSVSASPEGSCGKPKDVEPLQPRDDLVPAGAVLVHHPSLTRANAEA